jgi:hypothetical protein
MHIAGARVRRVSGGRGVRMAPAGRPEPDPARGSAGVSTPQSRFEGSDRQGRGRLVDALRRERSVAPGDIAATAGWPDDPVRAARAVASLVRDGLVVEREDGTLSLA